MGLAPATRCDTSTWPSALSTCAGWPAASMIARARAQVARVLGQLPGAQAQRVVELGIEARLHAQQDERPDRGEQDGRGPGERDGQPDPQRQAIQESHSR